jgi:hypothetical protein
MPLAKMGLAGEKQSQKGQQRSSLLDLTMLLQAHSIM